MSIGRTNCCSRTIVRITEPGLQVQQSTISRVLFLNLSSCNLKLGRVFVTLLSMWGMLKCRITFVVFARIHRVFLFVIILHSVGENPLLASKYKIYIGILRSITKCHPILFLPFQKHSILPV